MNLILKRTEFTNESTIGSLSLDGQHLCFTLEDVVRTGEKVYGKTAIPAGKYDVTITMSNRFKRRLPLLKNVTNFEGVRIHKGNSAVDTLGCILVGKAKTTNRISNCAPAFDLVFDLIDGALARGDRVTLEIVS